MIRLAKFKCNQRCFECSLPECRWGEEIEETEEEKEKRRKRAEYQKAYREANKERINQRARESRERLYKGILEKLLSQ